ncbi:MAG: hypothetical protein ACRD0P_34670, partial [Stackebrandtia sp.]
PPADLALVHLGGAAMPSTHAARTAAVATVSDGGDVVHVAGPAGLGFVLAAGTMLVGDCLVYLGAPFLSGPTPGEQRPSGANPAAGGGVDKT